MPLPRNVPRGHQSGAKRPSRDERQESIDETTAVAEKRFPKNELEFAGRPQFAGRSHSTDVTALKNAEKRSIIEQRRHTDCSDPRTIATRWIGQNNETKFQREISPLARIGCEITKSATTRWMTFVKNPSPSPIPRANSERRSSKEYDRKDEESCKDSDSSKWQPSRKFSPAKSEKGHLQRQEEIDIRDRSSSVADANERANKLSQRMRDLYDFKTENEWPKRAGSSPRENSWISKSSSEEERNNYPPVRRNSQDLEFNRFDGFKLAQHEEERRRPKRSTHNASEVFDDTEDERLRRFNDRVRYCEDRSKVRTRGRERRTYSDDYEEKARRESRLARQSEPLAIKRDRPEAPLAIKRLADKENKRNSDVSVKSRDSRVSYAEIDFQKSDPRPSDASYASVTLCKRSSIECKSTQKILEVPPRRAFSQSDERPSTPIPPIEFNDERYVPKKLPESPKRDSTRYKVYLT